ncbi:MAG: RnfABCDGE type electron transport complex subunit D [Oscillospiraceae bacterium]|nr:RnfABCDGE type electron transport complex subunit D [Oscillospiraceae bacterium]
MNNDLIFSPSPHIKTPNNSRVLMIDVLVALTPALIWGVIVFGPRALTVVTVSILSCVIFETLFRLILKRPQTILDFSAVVTGLLLAFNLPASVPLWIPIVGAFFAIVIVKQLFGGIGKNIMNPALAARVFLYSWSKHMTAFPEPSFLNGEHMPAFAISINNIDATASATPLTVIKQGAIPSDTSIFDMLIGNCAGTIGEISAVLLILGGLFLLARKVITWHIPVTFIGTVAVLAFLKNISGSSIDFMLYEILGGGLMLGAFFMATDYATSPVTKTGRLIYGAGCGLLTVLFRFYGGYAESVSFAILIMNLLVWYIDRFTKPVRFGGKN